MTGSTEYGIIPLGNDLEFKCNEGESVIELVNKLHKYYMPVNLHEINKETKSTSHQHYENFSPFITSTDICTIMLYRNVSKVELHKVISEKFISVFNSSKLTLNIWYKEE